MSTDPKDRRDRLKRAGAALMQLVRQARTDRKAFIELVFRDDRGDPIAVQPFQEQWLRALATPTLPHIYISAPRGHGKTTLSLHCVLFELGCNPNLRIKLIAQTDEKAKDRLFAIKQELESNKLLRLVFPDLTLAANAEDSKTKITVERAARSKDPSIHACGVLSATTGARADVLFFDDICDWKNTIQQPQLRETIKSKVLAEWIPTLEPQGRIITLATPWTTTDANEYMRMSPDFHRVETPVGTDTDPFAPIWPDRWGRDKLQAKYRVIGPVEYDRNYRLIALSHDAVPVQPGWIQYYDADLLGDPWKLYCLQCYDLAISQSRAADYFAGVTLLYDPGRDYVFVSRAWHERLGLRQQAERVVSEFLEWRPDRVGLEFGGYQGAFAEYLQERAPVDMRIWPFRTRGLSKERRLTDHTPRFDEKRIFFHPALDPNANPAIGLHGDIVSELLSFPLGKHDDMVDCLSMGLSILHESFPSGHRGGDNDGFDVGDGVQVRVSII